MSAWAPPPHPPSAERELEGRRVVEATMGVKGIGIGVEAIGVLKTECQDNWEGRTTSPSLAGPGGHQRAEDSGVLGKSFFAAGEDPPHPHLRCGEEAHLAHPPFLDHPLIALPTKTEIETREPGVDSEPPLCAGCAIRITDKFYLCAVERKWHSSCLKCCECGAELENEASCFEREGRIYCRDDYLRLYGGPQRTCGRCHTEITCTDLVMKARHCVFHVECFKCFECNSSLRKGDLFGMFEDVLYCRLHFEMMTNYGPPNDSLDCCPPPPLHSPSGELYPGLPHPGMLFPGPPPGFPGPPDHWPYGPAPDFGPGLPDYQFNNNNEPIKKRRGRKKRKVDEFAAMNGYMEGYPPGMEAHGVGQAKTKRARTSFKHHQLRIMKGHFQINQNPDSRELKMLSQKTGLDKKVLQVWFQNARAKWRRMNAQGGATVEGVLGPDDDMKGDEEMSPGDCGSQNSLISCC